LPIWEFSCLPVDGRRPVWAKGTTARRVPPGASSGTEPRRDEGSHRRDDADRE